MTLPEILRALCDAGVARATLSPAGELLSVEFAPPYADAPAAPRDPYGVPRAYQSALDALSGGLPPSEEPQ